MKIKTITDEELLDWILAGRITMTNSDSSDPVILQDGRERTPSIVFGSRGATAERWRVRFYRTRKRRSPKRGNRPVERTIVRSKIVWMIHNRSLVPEGHELDHDDENRLNDSALNIVALTHAQHSEKHYGNGYEDIPE